MPTCGQNFSVENFYVIEIVGIKHVLALVYCVEHEGKFARAVDSWKYVTVTEDICDKNYPLHFYPHLHRNNNNASITAC